MPFFIVYYILSVVLFFIALPLLFYLSFKQKYKISVPSRFFLFKNKPFNSIDAVWFHVCSLGEARALKPILNGLKKQSICITTITQTGNDEAKKYDAEVRYLPYEMFLPFWIKKQKFLVVLEAEFWYLLFVVARAKGARVILLNGRISDKSVKSYMKFKWFYKKLLDKVEIIYAQSQTDKNRFLALGAKNIEVIGNIKLAGEIKKTKTYHKVSRELIVAGSTHSGEEKIVLDSFVKYNQNSMLVVVPRHPERFEEVYTLMQEYALKYNLTLSRFSQTKELETDLVLVDMMGELNNIYAISDIAILGGAFKDDVGGHNPLEPAYFGCKIITGKHFFHQKELFKYVKNVQYVENYELLDALKKSSSLPSSFVEEEIDLKKVFERLSPHNSSVCS